MYNNGNSSKNVTGTSVVDGTLENADYADNGLSGDKIDGGIISNFQSTGIDDRLPTGKVLTLSTTGADIDGSVTCDGFTSTGIDDNATSTAITIDASEDVGIGTGSPDGRLHISKVSDTDYEALKLENIPTTGGDTASPYIGFHSNPGNGTSNTLSTGRIYGKFDTNAYASARTTICSVTGDNVFVDVLTVKDGKVGIGNSSPATTLTVSGAGPNGMELDRNLSAASQSARMFFDSNVSGTSIYNISGNLAFNTGAAAGTSSGTEKVRILSSGGITFNGDTAAANALDDYEEGYWTPTVTGATSGSFSVHTYHDKMAYTKIGRVVNVQGRLQVSGESSPVGEMRISLPFTSFNFIEGAGDVVGSAFLTDGGGTGKTGLMAKLSDSKAYCNLISISDSGVDTLIDASHVDTTFSVYLNFSYAAA